MSKRNTDVPGNSVLSAAVFHEQMAKTGMLASRLEHHLVEMSEEGITITSLRFCYRAGPTGDVLCVIGASTENGKIVAFHGGDSFADTMRGVVRRIAGGSLKWKEDEYAK